MEYTVITRLGKDEFIEQVNEKIKEGWTPLGGVATSLIQYENQQAQKRDIHTHVIYSQAFTR